eukprot:403377377
MNPEDITDKLLGKRKNLEVDLVPPTQLEEFSESSLFKRRRIEDILTNTIWYKLETWPSPKSYNSPGQISVEQFVKYILKEYAWQMDTKIEQVSVNLQSKMLEIDQNFCADLYKSTINAPIVVSWARAMKIFKREDFIKDIYPKIAQRRKFGKISHQNIISKANELQPKVNILNVRLNIVSFMRTFGSAARDIWKKDTRLQELASIIIKAALDPRVDPLFEQFQIIDNFRVNMMKMRRDFRLTVIDKATDTHGFLVVTHKKMTKEAVYKGMEDLRFICRARNIDHLYAFATNMYEWQIIYYNRQKELKDEKDFFQISDIFKLYVKQNNYSYGDNEMKMLIALVRSLIYQIIEEINEYKKTLIVERTCIDNVDEIF